LSDVGRPTLAQLQAVCAASAFNAWAGFELIAAADGQSELRVEAKTELLQHSGFLHAGVIAGLLDTAAGFAAASVAGSVLTSSFQTTPYRPAVGGQFVTRAHVVRAGKRQLFVNAELFSVTAGVEKLVAGGTAVLITAS
jgi:uncharacterized protein (TIGR00369 family)